MSLDWNISNVKDYENLCWIDIEEDDPMRGWVKGQRRLNPVTESLIWRTMIVDMGQITKKNYKEFFTRLRIYEDHFGGAYFRDGEVQKITLQEVKDHIGLSTNVYTETTSKWMKRFFEMCLREAQAAIRNEERELVNV